MSVFKNRYRAATYLSALVLMGMGIVCLIFPFLRPTPCVSVVLPTYNRLEFLPRAIESILNQTLPDFELIIVDDGSTDESWDLIRSYVRQDSRVKGIRHAQNRGVAAARNTGIRQAQGQYIAVMDSDDVAYPDRLEKSVAFLNAHPDITAVTGRYVTNQTNTPNVWVPPKRLEILMYFGNYFTHPALIRRSFLTTHNIRYNETLPRAEDYDLWAQIIAAGGRLFILNDVLMYLRRHHTWPKEDYKRMQVDKKLISARLLGRFGIPKEAALTLSRCDLMAQMKTANRDLNHVDKDALAFIYAKECTAKERPANRLYVKGIAWLDNLYPQGRGFYRRETTNDLFRADFVGNNGLMLTDRQGEASYFEQEKGAYNQINEKKFKELLEKTKQ